MDIKVKDIMERDVYKITPSASVGAAMRYMNEKGVSGLPIVASATDNHLLGFVSDGDMMHYLFQLGKEHDPLFAHDFESLREQDLHAIEALKDEMDRASIMDIATRKVVVVYENDNYDEAARILGKRKIKKVPVLNEHDEMVGVLSRSKMLRFLFEESLKRK